MNTHLQPFDGTRTCFIRGSSVLRPLTSAQLGGDAWRCGELCRADTHNGGHDPHTTD